ncbi:tyrosine-type recombinase/integrase [Listeria valentina]|uniref:tyrosine-type recombinase/integrase n=1 Tax=Listeria valentina TaxID=2705293 RepID=UPI001432251F|nr:site-specific integrase [Listeria valentina]
MKPVFDKEKGLWTWRVRVRMDGKQKERSGRHKDREVAKKDAIEAYNALMKEKEAIEAGIDVSQKDRTLEDFMTEWFETQRVPILKTTTINNRRIVMQTHIFPKLGHIPMSNISRKVYKDFINSLVPILSVGTIRLLNSIVQSCFDYLRYELDVDIINPAERVKIPKQITSTEKKQDEKNKFYTDEEIEKILACKSIKPVYIDIIRLIIDTGLRIGEILGLLEENYDSENKALVLESQLLSTSRRENIVFGSLKTEDSERVVYLDDKANELIKKRIRDNKKNRLKNPEFKQKYNFIFNDKIGRPMLHTTFRKAIKSVCYKTGVTYHTKHPIHAFRHTHAKRLADAGVNEIAIQQRLGHTLGSQVTKVYMHADDKTSKEAIHIYANRK